MITLEELMGQTQFKDERLKTHVGVLFVANLIARQQSKIFEPHGLNHQKFNTLRILRGQYPKAASEKLIREKVIDKTADFPRLLLALSKAGLINRVRNENDKRIVDVIITHQGLQVLAELDKVQHEIIRSIQLINEEEAQVMNALLQKMLQALVK